MSSRVGGGGQEEFQEKVRVCFSFLEEERRKRRESAETRVERGRNLHCQRVGARLSFSRQRDFQQRKKRREKETERMKDRKCGRGKEEDLHVIGFFFFFSQVRRTHLGQPAPPFVIRSLSFFFLFSFFLSVLVFRLRGVRSALGSGGRYASELDRRVGRLSGQGKMFRDLRGKPGHGEFLRGTGGGVEKEAATPTGACTPKLTAKAVQSTESTSPIMSLWGKSSRRILLSDTTSWVSIRFLALSRRPDLKIASKKKPGA